MKVLIIAKNLKYFWNHIQDRFSNEEISKVIKNQGRVLLKNGDEIIYISSNNKLRGHHGVKVEMWSIPDWYEMKETEYLARSARLP